jgi:hypothetical protein
MEISNVQISIHRGFTSVCRAALKALPVFMCICIDALTDSSNWMTEQGNLTQSVADCRLQFILSRWEYKQELNSSETSCDNI